MSDNSSNILQKALHESSNEVIKAVAKDLLTTREFIASNHVDSDMKIDQVMAAVNELAKMVGDMHKVVGTMSKGPKVSKAAASSAAALAATGSGDMAEAADGATGETADGAPAATTEAAKMPTYLKNAGEYFTHMYADDAFRTRMTTPEILAIVYADKEYQAKKTANDNNIATKKSTTASAKALASKEAKCVFLSLKAKNKDLYDAFIAEFDAEKAKFAPAK